MNTRLVQFSIPLHDFVRLSAASSIESAAQFVFKLVATENKHQWLGLLQYLSQDARNAEAQPLNDLLDRVYETIQRKPECSYECHLVLREFLEQVPTLILKTDHYPEGDQDEPPSSHP
jgi:hypothetical protein